MKYILRNKEFCHWGAELEVEENRRLNEEAVSLLRSGDFSGDGRQRPSWKLTHVARL